MSAASQGSWKFLYLIHVCSLFVQNLLKPSRDFKRSFFSFYLFSGIIVLWKLYKDAPIIIQSPTRLCEFTQKVQIKQQDLHLKVWRYFSKAFTFFSFYAQRSPITPLTNIFSKLVFWNCSKTILEFRKVRIKTSFNWQWADKQEI